MHNDRLLKLTTIASLSIAIFLFIIKIVAWYFTNSVSMQASLIDSLVDSVATLVNFIALRHALAPADNEHRFGHGKIEALAAQGQSFFVAVTALWIIYEAVIKIINPQPVQYHTLGISVIIVTIILSSILIKWQNRVIEKTNSTIIKSDQLHFKGDLLLNISVLTALILEKWLNWPYFDPICGLFIGFYIIYTSWKILKNSLDILIDRELDDDTKKIIENIVLTHPEVLGMHELKTRSSGTKNFIQLHIELNGHITLKHAHEITQAVEEKIHKIIKNSEIIIHQDEYIES